MAAGGGRLARARPKKRRAFYDGPGFRSNREGGEFDDQFPRDSRHDRRYRRPMNESAPAARPAPSLHRTLELGAVPAPLRPAPPARRRAHRRRQLLPQLPPRRAARLVPRAPRCRAPRPGAEPLVPRPRSGAGGTGAADVRPRQRPLAIARHLCGDPQLQPLLERYPGLRLPVAFDPFEQGVRTIIGQQVTVKAAVTIAGRLVERLGEPLADSPTTARCACSPPPAPSPTTRCPASACPASGWRRCAASPTRWLPVPWNSRWPRASKRSSRGSAPCPASAPGPPNTSPCAPSASRTPSPPPTWACSSPFWGDAGISAKALASRAEHWRPWRAYAAVYLWHSYASEN